MLLEISLKALSAENNFFKWCQLSHYIQAAIQWSNNEMQLSYSHWSSSLQRKLGWALIFSDVRSILELYHMWFDIHSISGYFCMWTNYQCVSSKLRHQGTWSPLYSVGMLHQGNKPSIFPGTFQGSISSPLILSPKCLGEFSMQRIVSKYLQQDSVTLLEPR